MGQDATIGSAIDSGAGTLTINADNDISLSANLTTSNTSDSAIVLNAGKNDAAGTGSGGDVQAPVPHDFLWWVRASHFLHG